MLRTSLALLAAALVAAPMATAGGPHPTRVQVLAVNDFHGNLQPPTGSSGRIATGPGASVDAGGAEYLATWVQRLEQEAERSYFVGAGDLVGASPLISGLFHDEPTVESLSLMGMDYAGVGNHEFDEGLVELRRLQDGGCHPADGCQDGDPFTGAAYRYLAANVIAQDSGRAVLPPYKVVRAGSARLAFIGLTLEDTPKVVTPAGVEGLRFLDEADTVNALVRRLRREQGIRAFVVLVHQGGQQNAPYGGGFQDVNGCENLSGEIVPIVQRLDRTVDAVVSAHTHQPYVCTIDGRLVTGAASFGRLVTDIDLVLDRRTRDVVSARARNVVVTRDVPADPRQTQLIAEYQAIAAPIANRVVGSVTADVTRATTAAGESALGDLIADAQHAATAPPAFGGAVVAFMNPGGIRADIVHATSAGGEAPGEVTYGELYSVQPFANTLTVKTLTGEQLYRLLEQQFDNPAPGEARILQVSDGFAYAYDRTRPAGARVLPGSVTIGGIAVDPAAAYRVAMNSFLASGGDGFGVFAEGTDQLGGEIDLDALVAYFEGHSPATPGPRDRITRED